MSDLSIFAGMSIDDLNDIVADDNDDDAIKKEAEEKENEELNELYDDGELDFLNNSETIEYNEDYDDHMEDIMEEAQLNVEDLDVGKKVNNIRSSLIDSDEVAEAEEKARDTRILCKGFEKFVKKSGAWGYDKRGEYAKRAAMAIISTKHGMYASVPIQCGGASCPFKDTCELYCFGGEELVPVKQKCPIETSFIEKKYSLYDDTFDLEDANAVDNALVEEIITLDVMIRRSKILMNINNNGDMVEEAFCQVDQNGIEHTKKEVVQYLNVYHKNIDQRNKLYDLMMSTRKSRKNDGEAVSTITTIMDNLDTKIIVPTRPDNILEDGTVINIDESEMTSDEDQDQDE